jgi:hypothetical protein
MDRNVSHSFQRTRTSPRIPLEPAHVIALRTWRQFKATRFGKKAKSKAHHAAASEALRLYLEHRFNFPALGTIHRRNQAGINRLPLRTHEIENID